MTDCIYRHPNLTQYVAQFVIGGTTFSLADSFVSWLIATVIITLCIVAIMETVE